MNKIAPIVLAVVILFWQGLACALDITTKIHGIKGEMLKNAKTSLTLQQRLITKAKPTKIPNFSVEDANRLALKGITEIATALKPYGYYEAKVTLQITKDENKWRVVYNVEPGKPVIVTELELTVTRDAENFPFYAKEYELEIGKPLNQAGYEKLKTRLATIANNLGYFHATFPKHEILLNLHAHTAQVNLVFDPGPRAKFGTISFSDNPLNDEFLSRYLPFREGAPFNQSLLSKAQSNLASNDNFRQVEVTADTKNFSENNQLLPIKANLTTKEPVNFTAGAGYGTDTGVRTQFGWQWRRVNSSGHSLGNTYNISEFRDVYRLNYDIPGHNPVTTHWTLGAGYTEDRSQKRNSDTHQQSLELGYSKQSPQNRLATEYRLLYEEESYREINEAERARILMPQLQWQFRDALDNILEPRYLLALQVRGANNNLFSSTGFGQGLASGGVDLALKPTLHSIWRGKIGATEQEDKSAVPPSLRFYAGGDQSVRGYAYQSLGPEATDSRGHTINLGGAYLLEGSTELEQQIYKQWWGAIFFDVGNAMNNWSTPLKQGAGVGIRWHTIVGVIKLDVASAISEVHAPLRLHFSIGPTF